MILKSHIQEGCQWSHYVQEIWQWEELQASQYICIHQGGEWHVTCHGTTSTPYKIKILDDSPPLCSCSTFLSLHIPCCHICAVYGHVDHDLFKSQESYGALATSIAPLVQLGYAIPRPTNKSSATILPLPTGDGETQTAIQCISNGTLKVTAHQYITRLHAMTLRRGTSTNRYLIKAHLANSFPISMNILF